MRHEFRTETVKFLEMKVGDEFLNSDGHWCMKTGLYQFTIVTLEWTEICNLGPLGLEIVCSKIIREK